MARAVLVSLADDVTNVGIRSLAATLEANGVEAHVVMLPRAGETAVGQPSWLPDLLDLGDGADVFGLGVMSIDAARARSLSTSIRAARSTPLVWGGPYPTLRPQACAPYADAVCVGDGESFLAALLAGQSLPNPAPLAAPVEVERAPRVALDRTWILDRGRIRAATAANLRPFLARSATSRDTDTLGYETVTSRGCPHACTFCGSTALKGVAPGRYFRGRSVDSILDELELARATYPYLTGIGFADDNFLARSVSWIEDFSRRYKARIGLPFLCLGSPATITAARLGPLVDAGLRRLKMGIQSGSEAVTRRFDRVVLNRRLDDALGAIAAYQQRMYPPRFDILVDLPFESVEDRIDTLALVARLPRPYRLELNSLRLMEGTPLHTQAVAEGWSTPDVSVNFKKVSPTWTNLVLALCRDGRMPGPMVATLGRPALVRTMSAGRPAALLRGVWGALRRDGAPP